MKNIVLTGLMGSGKTSVAKKLKEVFPEFELVETDFLIASSEGLSINEIFAQKGEKYFRGLENILINNLLKKENQIISLGGGSLENNFDFSLAKENSVMFYLSSDIENLYNRIKYNKDRPLLNCDNPKEKLAELLQKREFNYKKSDFIIDTNGKTIDEVVTLISRIYKDGNN